MFGFCASQPRQYIEPSKLDWFYNDTLAARAYYNLWEQSAKDTVVNIYVYKSVYWKALNGWDMKFSIDTIIGRGDRRQALFTITRKTSLPFEWRAYKVNYRVISDTITALHIDSTTTIDSTHRRSVWLAYETAPVAGGMELVMDNETMTVYLEKILGDPTKFNGLNQLCKLHFILRDRAPEVFINKYFKDNI